MGNSGDRRSSSSKISRTQIRHERFKNVGWLVAQRRAQLVQIEASAFRISFVPVIDQGDGPAAQGLPSLGVYRDFLMKDNLTTALQELKSLSDLVSAEVRFPKNGLFSHKSVHQNFGANAKIDIVRRVGSCHE